MAPGDGNPSVDSPAKAGDQARMEAVEAAKRFEEQQKKAEAEWKQQHVEAAAEKLETGRADVKGQAAAARENLFAPAPAATPAAAPSASPQAAPSTAPSSATAAAPTTAPAAAAPAAAPSATTQAAPAAAPSTAPAAAPSSAPAAAPASTPSAAPSRTSTASPSATPAPTATPPDVPPPPSAGEGSADKIKGFFKNLLAGIFGGKMPDWLGKFFGNKAAETATASATATPPTPSQSPAAAPSTGSERSPESRRNWREMVNSEAQRLNIDPAFALAIVTVEAGKQGLQPDGKPTIRFEAHVFNSNCPGEHGKWGASKLVGRNVDGVSCEGGQAAEQACFAKAVSINKEAAYKSISMGMGQIMGFNAKLAGYASAEDMYNRFSGSGGGESEQVRAMFKVIEKAPALLTAARNNDFSAFARGYNGAQIGTAKHNQYMAALERAYRGNGGTGGAGTGSRPSSGSPSAVA